MYECLKDFNCIKDWVIGNLLWEVILIIAISIFFRFLPQFISAIKITKIIWKNNRDTRDNGLGKYSADRFFDIWYSSKRLPLRYGGAEFYPKRFGLNSRHWLYVIDDELMSLGLIEKFDHREYQAVRPIKNFRNNLIAKMAQFYLIKFIGDNPQYYRNLEEQSRGSR